MLIAKKALAFLLCIFAIMLFLSPFCGLLTASATSIVWTCSDNGVDYELTDNGTLTCSGTGTISPCIGNAIIDPDGLDKKLYKVIIDEGITSIEHEAFFNCFDLENVIIPSSVNEIGYGAFYGCSSLCNIVLPEGIIEIKSAAFAYTGLEKVVIPNSVELVENAAFGFCESLTEVTIGQKTKTLVSPFTGSNNLKIINYNAVEAEICSLGVTIENLCLHGSTNECVTAVNIGNNVKSIPTGFLCGFSKLTEIIIPESVEKIEDGSFIYCNSVDTLIYNAVNADVSPSWLLWYEDGGNFDVGFKSLKTVSIGENVVKLPFFYFATLDTVNYNAISAEQAEGRPHWIECSIADFIFGESVKIIPPNLCYECRGINNLTISEGIETLNQVAFYNCDIKTINYYAVSAEYGLEGSIGVMGGFIYNYDDTEDIISVPCSVFNIGNEVKSIPLGLISGMTELKTITIPTSVKKIGDYNFSQCPNLSEINVGSENTAYISVNGVLFSKDEKTIIKYPEGKKQKEYIIPEGTENIAALAFMGTSIERIILPESLSYIGEYAFACGMTDLMSENYLVYNEKAEEFYLNSELVTLNYVYYPEPAELFDMNCIVEFGNNELIEANWHCPLMTFDEETEIIVSYDKIVFDGEDITLNIFLYENESDYNTLMLNIDYDQALIYDITVLVDNEGTQPNGKLKIWIPLDEAFGPEIPSIYRVDIDGGEIQKTSAKYNERIGYLIFETDNFGQYAVVYGASDKPTHEHIYKEEITKQPTCKENGIKNFTCTVEGCGDSYTEPVAKLVHTPGDWITTKEPTEIETGLAVNKCTACGDILEQKELPKLEIVKDEETGIELTLNSADYEGEATMSVEESFDGAAFNIVNTQVGAVKQEVYDVKLLINGEETQPNGKIKVKIPLPAGYDPTRTFVYHVNTETGKVEKMNAVYENGFMVFETDHFSYYAIVEENPTANAKLNVRSSQTVDYRSTVTVTATATGVPEGYVLAIYDGNTLKVRGNNTKVSYKIPDQMKSDMNLTIKVVDPNNKDAVQKDCNGKDLTDNCEIKVKSKFFDKIIAFFKELFGLLSKIEIKP